MIAGVGMDMEEIARFERIVSQKTGLSHIFGPEELAFLQKQGRLESYAANFCAKEAFSKALGKGLRGFRLAEAELLRDPLGKPYFKLSGRAAESAAGLRLSVSLTHSGTYAAAVVVAEREDAPLSFSKTGETNL